MFSYKFMINLKKKKYAKKNLNIGTILHYYKLETAVGI